MSKNTENATEMTLMRQRTRSAGAALAGSRAGEGALDLRLASIGASASPQMGARPNPVSLSAPVRRLLVFAVVFASAGLAVGVCLMSGQAGARYANDADLARLLQGMAGVKAILAAPLFAAAWVRLGSQATPTTMALYAGALSLSAIGVGVLASLGPLGVGALAFHAGWITFVAAAHRDDHLTMLLDRAIFKRATSKDATAKSDASQREAS
ncbi:MAG: hypothetical protein AAF850_05575 [Pseudomonadota bacterium]